MTPTTQYLCPLACGWTHEQGVPDLSGVPGGTVEEIVSAGLMRQYAADEIIIRERLETHSLLEWAQALNAARVERDEWKQRAEAGGRRLGDLLNAVRERVEATGGDPR